jgi:hypothetical protein
MNKESILKINDRIKEIMSSENNLVNEIKRNGFDILKDYKILDSEFENGIIKNICFELRDNPLNTDWDYNGCIILLFDLKEDKIQCQVQSEAVTEDINYSNFAKYNEYYDREYEFPCFKNETDFDNNIYCNFNNHYDTRYFKTINIFKSIAKYIIKSDLNIKDCIDTQDKINDFEYEYYEKVLDLDSENKYGKIYDDLTDEEQQELIDERDGIATYNMMVREGWIDED